MCIVSWAVSETISPMELPSTHCVHDHHDSAYSKHGIRNIRTYPSRQVYGSGIEGVAIGISTVDGNVPDLPTHFERLHLALDLAVRGYEACDSAVGSSYGGAPVLD